LSEAFLMAYDCQRGLKLVSAVSSQQRGGSAAFLRAGTALALCTPRRQGSGHQSASVTGMKVAPSFNLSDNISGNPSITENRYAETASINQPRVLRFFLFPLFLIIPCPLVSAVQGSAPSPPHIPKWVKSRREKKRDGSIWGNSYPERAVAGYGWGLSSWR